MHAHAKVSLLARLVIAVTVSAATPPSAAAPPPDDAITRALKKAAASAPPPPVEAGPAVVDALTPGKAAALKVSAANRGARLTVHSVALRGAYGSLKPSRPGARLLVLDTEWENVIPLTYVYERQVPTEYRIPTLSDHAYVVVNGRIAARLRPDGGALPGHVPVKDFRLERIGAVVRGNLVFEMPPEDLRSLDLRFYDYAHGHITVPLLAAPAPPAAVAKPLAPPQKNEVLEAAVFAVTKAPELDGVTAPAGMTFVSVDLRARSTFTVDADAEAFDPKARKGSKTKVGHVADWKESRRYLQLVADGEYAYAAEAELTELEEEPRFLPDVMTGGRVVFLAPEASTSLELRCDFPNAKASTGGPAFRPQGLTLAVEGKRPALPNRPALASIDDDNCRISVVGQRAETEIQGQPAGDGNKFLVLDVTVANRGSRNGEFFQTPQQLKYASETGRQVALSPLTFQGPRRAAELIWIPPTERRTFQAVFEIPEKDTRPRLAFNGVTKAEVLNLKPLEALAKANANAKPNAAPMSAEPQAAAPVKVAANANPKPDVAVAPPQVTAPLKRRDKDAKPLRVAAKQSHEPKGLAGVGLTAEQVNASIDRGAEFLWNHTKKEMAKDKSEFGRRLGYDVLVALALVHSNYHKKSPEFDAALRSMLSKVDPTDLGTYGAGILAMLIESYGDGYYVPKLRDTVRCIVENQGPDGSWGYSVDLPPEMLADPNALRVLQVRGGVPLEGEAAAGEKIVRKRPWDDKRDGGDNSTSQYAMLGLWAAARGKVNVAPDVWKRALESYRNRQGDDGGWNYSSKSYGYGSMTCAGVCSVALARHHLGEAAPADDEAVERGLAWLHNHFTVSKHPEGSGAHFFYYIYSLERVGRILDTEFIGDHEWYPLGAKELLGRQKADGSWVGDGDEARPELATSFALLFLTRATSTLNVEQKRGGDGRLRTDVAVAPGHRVYIILDCSGSMLSEIGGTQKFQIARDAVASLVKELPDNAEVALRAYGHRKNARQEGADEDTELVVPMQKLDRRAFAAKLNGLRPRGKTPMALSLREAAKDLSGLTGQTDSSVTLVLLTDGGEDTRPRQDPLAAAEDVAKLQGINFQLVGFDISRADWTEQLQAMADRGRGQYLPAGESDALLRELRSAVFRVPETFTVADAKGRPMYKGTFGTTRTLPEGKYTLATTYGGKRYTQEFWVNTDATTAVVFDAANIAKDKSGRAVADAREEAPAPRAAARQPARAGTGKAPAPALPAKKFCTECGKPLTAGAKFCPNCGAKVAGG